MIRRSSQSAVLAMLTLLASGSATAQASHETLRGAYRLTCTRTCAVTYAVNPDWSFTQHLK